MEAANVVRAGALSAPVAETLHPLTWMLLGFIGAGAFVLGAQALPGEPAWPAVGAGLLAVGAVLVAASLHERTAWREQLAAFGAGILATPGLVLGSSADALHTLPGLAVPLVLIARPFTPGLRVASVALLAVAGGGMEATMPWLGDAFALVWIVVVAVAVAVWFVLPREGPWRTVLLPAAAGVALFFAAL